ncbi:hypothetical protein Tco_0374176 [Tanacetum coccineum]
MAFSFISISSDSSEESVGTSTARVILFGTIPTTIPSTAPTVDLPSIHDDTPLIPTDTPIISPIVLGMAMGRYISPFICTDSSDSDTPDSPPSQDPYEVTVARWRSRVAAHSSPPSSFIRQILPAPSGLPRRPTSSNSHSDSSSDSSSRHSSSSYAISETPCDSTTATFERSSSKRCRSPSVPISLPVRRALSPVCADLLPPPKRIRDSDSVTYLEISSEDGYKMYVPREVGLGVDVEDSYEPYTEPDIDSDVQAAIDECIAYADAIRARGMDDRDVVETATAEEVESSARGMIEAEVDPRVEPVVNVRESVREDDPNHVTADGAVEVTYETLGDLVQRFHDHAVEIPVYRIQVIESEQRLQGYRITIVDLEVTTMTKRIDALERDNTRLRGMLDVEMRLGRLEVGARRLGLLGHSFDIDLIHVELGSFDVIVEGDGCNGGSKSKLSIISCTKTQKYIQKGCQVYLAQVTAKKSDDEAEEKRLEDVPVVRDFLEKFNPYARYGVEHWKNPHAKIFYIRKQKEPGKPKEEIYSNSKIVQVIKTYWELGHEHKFITEIVARRANDCIVSITEPDYKNLNKNDIEDIYLLIMNGKIPDYADTGLLWSLSVFIRSSVIWERVHDFQLGIESYQQKVNLTAPTITFPGIEEHDMFSIIYEPVHGIIYKNSKKEKRVMRHTEIHKFCDATLNRVLEGLKSYNNDVKYGYVQKDLTKDETEYLKLFEEEIKERLKHQRQMRRWEMYVNGRPLGLRRERPE